MHERDAAHTGGGRISAKDKREEGPRDAQSSCNETHEITDDAAAKGKDDGVPGAFVQEEKVLDFCLALAALRGLAGRDDVGQESRALACAGKRVLKFGFESIEVKACDVSVCDEGVGGGGESVEDGADDVGDEVKATVDGLSAEDGYFGDVCVCHGDNSEQEQLEEKRAGNESFSKIRGMHPWESDLRSAHHRLSVLFVLQHSSLPSSPASMLTVVRRH